MLAASLPIQRPSNAKLLIVDACGKYLAAMTFESGGSDRGNPDILATIQRTNPFRSFDPVH